MDINTAIEIFRSLPMDWLIIVIIALVSTVDCVLFGANRSVALTLAYPLALMLYAASAQAAFLSSAMEHVNGPYAQAGAFAFVLFLAWVIAYRLMTVFDAPLPLWLSLLCGAATAIIFIVFVLATAPIQAIVQLSGSIHAVFGDAYRFWWFALCYLVLAYARS